MTLPAWLQAVAAMLQAGVAVALLLITRRYVQLTGRLAAATEAQVEILRAERDEKRSERLKQLAGLAQRLLTALEQLPGPGRDAQQRAHSLITNAVLPQDDELQELRRLANAIGPAVGQLAQSASDNFGWLLNWARKVQATNPVLGFDYNQFKWSHWVFRWTEAAAGLKKLAGG
jgi:hypothetical protein